MSEVKTRLTQPVNSQTNALVLYVFGFVWSLILTFTAYFWTTKHIMPSSWLIYALCTLAAVQCAVQMYFFLHVSAGTRPRWKFISFWFMLGVVLLVIVGSIWIMHSLNYRMMSPSQIDKYMQNQQSF